VFIVGLPGGPGTATQREANARRPFNGCSNLRALHPARWRSGNPGLHGEAWHGTVGQGEVRQGSAGESERAEGYFPRPFFFGSGLGQPPSGRFFLRALATASSQGPSSFSISGFGPRFRGGFGSQ